MCEQEIALKLICTMQENGGLSKADIMLHEAQCRDHKKMEKRMTGLEAKVAGVDKKIDQTNHKVDAIDKKVDMRFGHMEEKLNRLLELANTNISCPVPSCPPPSPLKAVKEVLSNKVFLYLLITFMAACFGVSVGEVGVFLFK